MEIFWMARHRTKQHAFAAIDGPSLCGDYDLEWLTDEWAANSSKTKCNRCNDAVAALPAPKPVREAARRQEQGQSPSTWRGKVNKERFFEAEWRAQRLVRLAQLSDELSDVIIDGLYELLKVAAPIADSEAFVPRTREKVRSEVIRWLREELTYAEGDK